MSRLVLLLQSGEFDRIHYGLMMASAAAAVNKDVTIFVTMAACHAFTVNGWKQQPLSEGMHFSIPVATAQELDNHFRKQGVADFGLLLESCLALPIEWIFCETGLQSLELTANDLTPGIPVMIAGIVTLLNRITPDTAVITL